MTIIITGANRGLGYEAALALAANTTRTLVLAGRDGSGVDEAARRITTATGNANLIPMVLDLADLTAVRAFAAELRRRDLPPLSTVIANAGVSRQDVRARSADGYELAFAINHLGHFLLINLLLDLLRPPARILIVSSSVHDPAQAGGPMQPPHYVQAEWLAHPEQDPELLTRDKDAGGRAYASSKLCNVLHAYELTRRLAAGGISTPDRPVTVNAFDPGLMAGTGLGRDSSGFTRLMWYYVMPLLARVAGFGRTVQRSGADLTYLATAPELAGVTGRYFSGRELMESSAASYDLKKAADLWDTSVRLTHLSQVETLLPLGERT